MSALAQQPPIRTCAGQSLIQPEDVAADVLQAIAARQVRVDIATQLRQHFVALLLCVS